MEVSRLPDRCLSVNSYCRANDIEKLLLKNKEIFIPDVLYYYTNSDLVSSNKGYQQKTMLSQSHSKSFLC